MQQPWKKLSGVGIGWRQKITDELLAAPAEMQPAFVEFAPENWMGMGGYWKDRLRKIADKYPMICHGLSLSIGSPDPLDMGFLGELKSFFEEIPVALYSEHISYSQCDNAHLYDLLPIPFTQEAVDHIIPRIMAVQDFLERPIALENISYYTSVTPQISETEFINTIIRESGCYLLLDVNNVYVNAFNHDIDAKEFIKSMPLDRVAYIHMAGHEKVSEKLIIDTHGQPIIDPVYDLFEWALDYIDPVPVLLERDFNVPSWNDDLSLEVKRLQKIVDKKWDIAHANH
jgi:uncharacterized protein